VKAERGLTVERMVELARISRANYYRFDENAKPGFIPTWICVMPSSESRWNGPLTGGAGLPKSCDAEAGR